MRKSDLAIGQDYELERAFHVTREDGRGTSETHASSRRGRLENRNGLVFRYLDEETGDPLFRADENGSLLPALCLPRGVREIRRPWAEVVQERQERAAYAEQRHGWENRVRGALAGIGIHTRRTGSVLGPRFDPDVRLAVSDDGRLSALTIAVKAEDTMHLLETLERAGGRQSWVVPEPAPMSIVGSVVHACPPVGSGLTPCCGKNPFELPGTDRITLDKALVTCTGRTEQ